MANRHTLRNLQNRLDRQAIDQLRQEVVRLQERLVAAEKRADVAESRLHGALDDAEAWRDQAMELMEQAYGDGDGRVGLTKNGQLLVLPADARRADV